MAKTRNKFEARILKALKKAKVGVQYEPERIPYVIEGYYLPDFVFQTPSGKVYLETKGYLRPEHKRKMAAVKLAFPDMDLRILFYARKAKDIRWADKLGIKWAISDVPQDWLI